MKFKNPSYRLVPLLLFATVALAFVVGVLYEKVSKLEKEIKEKGKTAGVTEQKVTPTSNPGPPPESGKMTLDQVKRVPQVIQDDHIKGHKDAKVYLIEYSDYDCPFCARFHPTAQRVVDEYKGAVAWVYRHFPLDVIHPNARPKAEIAECTSLLKDEDAFWSVTDKIYSQLLEGQAMSIEDIKKFALELGVNESDFTSCIDERKTKSEVDEDYSGGLAAGITGTPGNIILNQKGEAWFIPGAVPFESLKQTIDEALK